MKNVAILIGLLLAACADEPSMSFGDDAGTGSTGGSGGAVVAHSGGATGTGGAKVSTGGSGTGGGVALTGGNTGTAGAGGAKPDDGCHGVYFVAGGRGYGTKTPWGPEVATIGCYMIDWCSAVGTITECTDARPNADGKIVSVRGKKNGLWSVLCSGVTASAKECATNDKQDQICVHDCQKESDEWVVP